MGHRTFAAKYDGVCCWCGTDFRKGIMIAKGRGGYGHKDCRPSGNSRADGEYYAGRRDAARYQENVRYMGQEAADAEEFARELREGWD
jgi:hypothetical protein